MAGNTTPVERVARAGSAIAPAMPADPARLTLLVFMAGLASVTACILNAVAISIGTHIGGRPPTRTPSRQRG